MALASEQDSCALGRLAAGVVRANDHIEGILLTEVPLKVHSASNGSYGVAKCTLTQAAVCNGATVLLPSLRLWVSVLRERIEKIQWREEAGCQALFAQVKSVAHLSEVLEREVARFLVCESLTLLLVDEQQEQLWIPCSNGQDSEGTVIEWTDFKDVDVNNLIEQLRNTG